MVLQIGYVCRQVATCWRDTEFVFQEKLFLKLGIVISELGNSRPGTAASLFEHTVIPPDWSACLAIVCIPLLDKELLCLGENAMLTFAKHGCNCVRHKCKSLAPAAASKFGEGGDQIPSAGIAVLTGSDRIQELV